MYSDFNINLNPAMMPSSSLRNYVIMGGTSLASLCRKLGIKLLQKLSLPVAVLCTRRKLPVGEISVLGFSPCQKKRHIDRLIVPLVAIGTSEPTTRRRLIRRLVTTS
jgi:hypothetical protein